MILTRAAAWLLACFAATTAAAQQSSNALPVTAAAAEQRALSEYVLSEGTARAVRREFLLFETDGKVDFVWQAGDGVPLKEGDTVKGPSGAEPGQLLAKLDQRSRKAEHDKAAAAVDQARQRLAAAHAQVKAAQAEFDAAESDLKRAEELMRKGVSTQARLDETKARFRTARARVNAAKAQTDAAHAAVTAAEARLRQAALALDQTELRAPFDGRVAYINVRRGDLVSRQNVDTSTETRANDTAPIVLIDDRAFEITLQLPVFDGARVAVGQRAWIVTGEALGKMQLEGQTETDRSKLLVAARVFSVSPSISPGNRSVRIKVRSEGDKRSLTDGSFASVWIEVARREQTIVLPYNAVIFRGHRVHAFVVDKASQRVSQRNLTVGLWGFDGIEVTEGIAPGELVVTKGRGRLANGQTVRLVASKGLGR